MHPLIQGNIDAVDQALGLLRSITTEQYLQVCRPFVHSSIGAHCRHILDNYQALINSVGSQSAVDYNFKRRGHAVETDQNACVEAFSAVRGWLRSDELERMITSDRSGNPDPVLTIRTEVTLESEHSVDVSSTLARELVFVSSHAVHHFAVMGICVRLQNGRTEDGLGLASATATHQRQLQKEPYS